MSDLTPFSRFQSLLADIFQFDTGDLDFGIYRILNAKRKQVEAFITTDLESVVDQAFGQYAAAKSAVVAVDLEAEREKVIANFGSDAFDASGQLVMYQTTPLGQAYLVMEKAAATSTTTDSLKAKVYNDLLTFFSRYYDEGDFLPLRRAGRDMTYAIPYNGEEVTLYWANKGQYYIKTDDRLAAYRFRAGAFHVALEVRSAAVEQNNNKGAKRYYILAPDASGAPDVRFDADAQTLHIYFVQRPLTEAEEKDYGKTEVQRPQDKLNASTVASVLAAALEPALRDALAAPYAPKEGEPALTGAPATLLRHLSQFTKKNTADFFIHRNLATFLRGELDQFIKTESLRLDELLNGGEGDYALQMARARATKLVGDKIIALLAQVEDFQKRLFEKRKFVMATHYVFTLDRVPLALHEQVLANAAQVQEWRDLYDVDGLLAADKLFGEDGLTLATLSNEPYRRLPVDTRHFDAVFKAELLGSVDDLDALTDGVLFNSENFQALNLMTETYRERVKCIYIDPPYNTGGDGFLYKDTYQHSSWLSMLADRLVLGRELMSPDGLTFVSIDENEHIHLSTLLSVVFGGPNRFGDIIWKNSSKNDEAYVSMQHEYIIGAVKNAAVNKGDWNERKEGLDEIYKAFSGFRRKHGTDWKAIHNAALDWYGQFSESNPVRDSSHYNWMDERGIYFAADYSGPRFGQYVFDVEHPVTHKICKSPASGWRCPPEVMDQRLAENLVHFGEDETTIPCRKTYLKDTEYQSLTSIKYRDGRVGSNQLQSMFGSKVMKNPKDADLIARLLKAVGANMILDFFAGSGTTGHAVINMSRETDIKRNYTLVEMGVYFDAVLLPRLKKATFASGWREGKPISKDAVSQTIKYHTLEQYEDSLNNLQLRPDAESQQALDVFGSDFLLQYMLDFDTIGSPSLLNVADLADPLAYTLRVKSGDDFIHQAVDLPETFSYLLGLRVRKVRSFSDAGREYRAVLGDKDGIKVAHIWRKSSDLADNADGLAQDAAFLTGTVLPELAPTRPDRVFVNGAFTLASAENCEPELFRLMFAPVGA